METISQFLLGIENERKRNLATKMQPLVGYLQEAIRVKSAEEQNQQLVGIATSDALERAKQSGYADDEIEGFRQSLQGVRNPSSVNAMYSEFEQGAQARRTLKKNNVQIPDNLSTPELVRMASESETKRQGNISYENKAKELGSEGYKTYTELVAKGSDPATAFGEAANQFELKQYSDKAGIQTENILSRKSSNGGGGSSTGSSKQNDEDRKKLIAARVGSEDLRTGKTSFVYWTASNGNKYKREVYTDTKGDVRFKDGGALVDLNKVLDAGSVNSSEHVDASPTKVYTDKASKKVENETKSGKSFVYFRSKNGEVVKTQVTLRNGRYHYTNTKNGESMEAALDNLISIEAIPAKERKNAKIVVASKGNSDIPTPTLTPTKPEGPAPKNHIEFLKSIGM